MTDATSLTADHCYLGLVGTSDKTKPGENVDTLGITFDFKRGRLAIKEDRRDNPPICPGIAWPQISRLQRSISVILEKRLADEPVALASSTGLTISS